MTKLYCDKFDAFFDKKTGKWMEKKCGIKGCKICSPRPKYLPQKTCKRCRWVFTEENGIIKIKTGERCKVRK
jgi:hypothetical protein